MAGTGEMNQRVTVLELTEAAGELRWREHHRAWAQVVEDSRVNLFSSVGIGARGVTLTLWRNPALTLLCALRWRDKFLFLTAITDGDDQLHSVVTAAVVNPVPCTRHTVDGTADLRFPGILTEKYRGRADIHEQLEPLALLTLRFVLVTPKAVTLRPGTLVEAGGKLYAVLAAHELDWFKNEYEIERREDC
ncbi:MAG: hypothetical protein RR295_06820 [Oscillospiraceae bacterium]